MTVDTYTYASMAIRLPEQLVVHHDAHPLAISELLDKAFGLDWYLWEPETLWREIELEFGRPPSSLAEAKIQAIRTMSANRSFWAMWEVFTPVCLALNNRLPDMTVLVKPTVPQIFVAVDIARSIDGFPFTSEVSRYMAAVFLDDGIIYAPPPMTFLQPYLEEKRYRCLDCGFIGEDENHRLCDFCLSPNIQKFDRNEITEDQKKRIDSIIAGDYDLLDESRTDVMGAKLKVAVDYMNLRRLQLEEQLKLVSSYGGK